MTTTALRTESLSTTDRRHLPGGVTLVAGGLTFLVGFAVSPGPAVADVHAATWVPGHALNAIGYLLMAIGLPAVAYSLGRRLGVLGAVGYVALLTRFVLSTGSHLYSMWTMPQLVRHGLASSMTSGKPLASIYSAHGDLINLLLGAALLGLAWALLRIGRPMRTIGVLVAITAVSQIADFPLALPLFGVVAIWLGLRLARRDDVTARLR